MFKKPYKSLGLAILFACLFQVEGAWAQSGDISDTLSRLQNNPRYQGRVLGTHLSRSGGEIQYEVRILRQRDDRVILVYIDPETGGVVGDSERSVNRPSKSNKIRDKNRLKRKNKKKRDRR